MNLLSSTLLILLACVHCIVCINSTLTYLVLPSQLRNQSLTLKSRSAATVFRSSSSSTTATSLISSTADSSDVDDDQSDSDDEDSLHSQDSDHDLMQAKHIPRTLLKSPSSERVNLKPNNLMNTEYELAPSDLINNLHLDELPVAHNEHYGHDELTPALASHSLRSADHFNQLSRAFKLNVKTKPKPTNQKQLLIVSFDAFRYDYNRLFRRQMPHFERIAREGVWAPMGIQTAYVTKTFPTHYSIATGKFLLFFSTFR